MKIYRVDNMPRLVLLGRHTETGVEEIRIDCAPWLALWPDLEISVWAVPPGSDAAYPASTHMEGDVLVWPVCTADTATKGEGMLEVRGIANGRKKLSATTTTRILGTMTSEEKEPPEAAQPWVDEVLEARDRAEAAAEKAQEAAESIDGGITIGPEHAGQLLYVGVDGKIAPLRLGAGLAIIDGALVVTNIQARAAICGQVLCGQAICGEV